MTAARRIEVIYKRARGVPVRTRCTVYGCTRSAKPPFKRCDLCRKHIRELAARIHKHRRELGLCKCGNKRAYKRRMCQLCLDYFSARAASVTENRRLDGICPLCGKRPPEKGCRACGPCLKSRREYEQRHPSKRRKRRYQAGRPDPTRNERYRRWYWKHKHGSAPPTPARVGKTG